MSILQAVLKIFINRFFNFTPVRMLIPPEFPDRPHHNAPQHQKKLVAGQGNGIFTGADGGQFKHSLLQAFAVNSESITFPAKKAELIAPAAYKDENGSAQGIFLHVLSYQPRQAIGPLSHIAGQAVEVIP
jgi:hypothetical protein